MTMTHRRSEPQREAFIRQEKQRIRAHIDSYVIPGALQGYSMEYRCDCGFACESSAEITIMFRRFMVSRRNRTGLALLIVGVAMAARTAAVDSSENIYIGLQVVMWINLFAGFKLFTEEAE